MRVKYYTAVVLSRLYFIEYLCERIFMVMKRTNWSANYQNVIMDNLLLDSLKRTIFMSFAALFEEN